jgi:histidinol phosphatase-like PHP family hydrolase
VNGGIGFPVTNDAGIHAFREELGGHPVFVALQAEGREWLQLFSREAIGQFDYVFTDAMTFTDDHGKRTRLWIRDEVEVGDPSAFMEMYVSRIVDVLEKEPIDVFVNPTFLPEVLEADYDRLWTPVRMQRVIDAAVGMGIAIEINDRYRIPSVAFVKLAKKAGAKFAFGTNNSGRRDLGFLEYCLDVQKECGLTSDDFYVPGWQPSRAARMH